MERGYCNPTLKKCGCDLAFKRFRRISNLQFVSKLVERAAADQLQSYLVKNNLFPTLQSAYGPKHSIETALLKIKNEHGQTKCYASYPSGP